MKRLAALAALAAGALILDSCSTPDRSALVVCSDYGLPVLVSASGRAESLTKTIEAHGHLVLFEMNISAGEDKLPDGSWVRYVDSLTFRDTLGHRAVLATSELEEHPDWYKPRSHTWFIRIVSDADSFRIAERTCAVAYDQPRRDTARVWATE